MARLHTNKTQRTGFKLLQNRNKEAFIRRNTTLTDSPFTTHTNAISLGIAGIGIIGITATLLNTILPDGQGAGQNTYIQTQSGTLYYKHGDTWHQMTNNTSVNLITGQPTKPTKTSNTALKNQKQGLPMGIVGAPGNTTITNTQNPKITTCSTQEPQDKYNQNETPIIETTLTLNTETQNTTPLTQGKMAIATTYDKSRYFLLFDGKRAEIDPNNDQVRAAFKISADQLENATTVSPKFLDTIPTVPPLETPKIENPNSMSQAIPGYKVTTVIVQTMPDQQPIYYLVGYDGIQVITEAVARLITTSYGSEIVPNPAVSVINQAQSKELINLNNYPTAENDYVQGNTICSQWEMNPDTNQAHTELKIGADVKVEKDITREKMSPTITGGDGPSTDRFYTGPDGKGWYVRVTDLNDTTITDGTTYYLSPEGLRFELATDDKGSDEYVAQAIGVSDQDAILIPWQILKLVPESVVLSKESALTIHETMPQPDVALSPDKENEESTSSSSSSKPAPSSEAEIPSAGVAPEPEQAPEPQPEPQPEPNAPAEEPTRNQNLSF